MWLTFFPKVLNNGLSHAKVFVISTLKSSTHTKQGAHIKHKPTTKNVANNNTNKGHSL